MRNQPTDKAWDYIKLVDLADSDATKSGELHVLIQSWDATVDSEPVKPSMGQLDLTVLQAKSLPKPSRRRAFDIYFECLVDGDVQRTSTVQKASSQPVWAKGSGEVLSFALMTPPERIILRAYDDNPGNMDGFIGKGVLKLKTLHVDHDQAFFFDNWVPLRRRLDEKAKTGGRAGAVRIFYQWYPILPLVSRRIVRIVVIRAEDLPSMDLM